MPGRFYLVSHISYPESCNAWSVLSGVTHIVFRLYSSIKTLASCILSHTIHFKDARGDMMIFFT